MTYDRYASELLSRFLRGNPTAADIEDCASRVSALAFDAIERTGRHAKSDMDGLLPALRATYREVAADHPNIVIPYFIVAYPELVFPLGFDEARIGAIDEPLDGPVSDDLKGLIGESIDESLVNVSRELNARGVRLLRDVLAAPANMVHYRARGGVWHNLEGVLDVATMTANNENRPFNEWIGVIEANWLSGAALRGKQPFVEDVVTLPHLWLPPSYGDSMLHNATRSIIRNIATLEQSLSDLHWRTLEELVAELLHDLGLQVTVTERSSDGGRDVIARGELIPGEPMLLAVEVKHRRTVPVSELRSAMWANRHFPALLFVTSGRFSAGVYKARTELDGRLRLFLKDGFGLQQWMTQYARRNFR